jgi:hypothetical protein
MIIEMCLRCGRPRDDADEQDIDDEWMPIFGPRGERGGVACPACTLPADQAALERWIDTFDQQASRRFALDAAVREADDRQFHLEYHAHDVFGRLFMGVDLQRMTLYEVGRWIIAWAKYSELVRLAADDPSRHLRAIELTETLLSLERIGIVPGGSAYAIAFAYRVTSMDVGPIAARKEPPDG